MASKHDIRTVFSLEGAEAYQSNMQRIAESQKTLSAEMQKATSVYKINGDKSEYAKKKIEILNKQIELQKQKVDQARTALQKANEKFGEGSTKTEVFKRDVLYAESALHKMTAQLQAAGKELGKQGANLEAAGEKWQRAGSKIKKVGDGMNNVGTKMSTAITAPLMLGAGYATKSAIDFESAFAGVRKTVDGTAEDFAKLEAGIRDMSKEMPTSSVEISKVAESAGQLGIQTPNILGFTKTIIDLGNATNLTGEEGAAQLAKFANITRMSQKDFDRLGSTIVDLGNNSATTEADIVAMAMRLAGAGKQAGMSEADIMGMAAALSSVGIEAEAGGSAMSKVMSRVQLAVETGNDDLRAFAAVAGMTSKEFADAFKSNAVGALTEFITGLQNTERNGKSANAVLESLEISEVRMRDTLLRASGAGDLFNKSIKLGNKAWKENTALVKEANERYKTSASQLAIQKNRIQDAAISIGRQLLPHFASMVEFAAKAAEAFSKLSPAMQSTILGALGVAAAIGPVLKIGGNVTKLFGGINDVLGKGISLLANHAAGAAASATAMTALEGGTAAAGTATGALTSALGPLGIAAGVAALAVGGLYAAHQLATSGQREYDQSINNITDGMLKYQEGINNAKSHLGELLETTQLTAEEQSDLNTKTAKTQESISQILNNAVESRRAMTEEEFERMKGLIGQLEEYAGAKAQAYEKALETRKTQIERAKTMTAQASQEEIKTAQETADKLIGIAQKEKDERYSKANDFWNSMKSKRDEVGAEEYAKAEKQYQDMLDQADRHYDEQVAKYNLQTGEMVGVVANKYMQLNAAELSGLSKIDEIRQKSNDLQKLANETSAKLRDENVVLTELEYNNLRMIEQQQRDDIAANNQQVNALYKENVEQHLANMASLVFNADVYGGKLDKSTRETWDKVLWTISAAGGESKEKAIKTIDQVIQGMIDKNPSVSAQAKHIKDMAIEAINTGNSRAYDIGVNMTDSFASGLLNNSGTVLSAANSIANNALVSMRSVLQIYSPSRKTRELGRYTTEGFAEGIDELAPSAIDKARQMSQDVLRAIKSPISSSALRADLAARVDAARMAIPSFPGSVRSGGIQDTAGATGGITTQQLKEALRGAIEGMSVELDKREVGRVVMLK